jgi:hypothetical protein
MTRKGFVLAASLSVFAILALAVAGVHAPPPAEQVDKARQAARGLMTDLKAELVAALEATGPAGAIDVCSVAAPAIAEAHSGQQMTVGRVSEKLRNPTNAPDDWERSQLERLAVLHEQGELPQEIAEVVDGKLRYMMPIVVAQPCLNCHGDPASIDPAVKAELARLYPEDEATGYEAGDLRGAVTVVIDLPREDGGAPAS